VTFTIERALAVSLAIHGAVILPVAIEMRTAEPHYDETLIVDLKGVTADDQSEERVTEQTAGSSASQAAAAQNTRVAQAGENRQTDETPSEAGPATAARPEKAAPTKAAPGSPGSVNIQGGEQQQEAHRIRPRAENPADPLQAYAKALSKRVQTKLVYPEAGRQAGLQGAATAAFTILPDGGLRPDSLKIVSSSGQSKLDESALKTIRACAPFDLPPREITLKITVKYGR
jgi:protein TonB